MCSSSGIGEPVKVGFCRYDSNNLITETYDWRLATPLLEKRDKYFSRLRDSIRTLHSNHDQKVLALYPPALDTPCSVVRLACGTAHCLHQ